MGVEAIVDYYIITISPMPLYPLSNVVYSAPWNATLDYNSMYIAVITAVNCAGRSGIFVITAFEYGMCTCYLWSCILLVARSM